MKKLIVALAFSLTGISAALAASPLVEVYKSPTCGCCGKWVEHMKQAGFDVKVHEVKDTDAIREKLGFKPDQGSCHSATVGGYALEGHVPAADVQRLLKEKPKAVGLAVPGMPGSAPGMDLPNKGPYESILVLRDGKTRVFARH